MDVFSALQQVEANGNIPMHMPGHKRNTALAPYLKPLGAGLDITEIHDCDCLHHPEGILRNAMDKAQALWGAEQSFLSVNGSTGGILAGIHATTTPGDTILMARACHKAVYNGVALCGLNAQYLPQNQLAEGYYHCVKPGDVETALDTHPQAKLVVITSPTYEGYVSDVGQIAHICHQHQVPLLVDEAHGAHLGFDGYFTGGAVAAGADIVVQSLHKTLPSLTQTAVVHVQGKLANGAQVGRSLSVFQTTSPSYLLMASIDGCLDLLQAQGADLFAHWRQTLQNFYQQMTALEKLKVVQAPSTEKDPSKILISTAHYSLDGVGLKEQLRTQYHIELEMAYGEYALAMTGLGDTKANIEALATALLELDRAGQWVAQKPTTYQLKTLPPRVMAAHQTHAMAVTPCPVDQGVGQVCGSYIWAYPPGVPTIVPGEVITPEWLSLLKALEASGVTLQDTLGLWPQEIGIIPGVCT